MTEFFTPISRISAADLICQKRVSSNTTPGETCELPPPTPRVSCPPAGASAPPSRPWATSGMPPNIFFRFYLIFFGRSYSQPPPHSHMNRSLPNMNAALPKAPKIYPIHLLLTSNYRLPNDVDRYKNLVNLLTCEHNETLKFSDVIWSGI